VTGYDANARRRDELKAGVDSTGEIPTADLAGKQFAIADDLEGIRDCNVYIVTVPTPIDEHNVPDLSLLENACRDLGGLLAAGDTVVFESTVYPGVTEDHCGALLQSVSGLRCGEDFFLGYSPERINPGDSQHSVEAICKVVAGQTPAVAEMLRDIYASAVPAGVHVAPNIKTAEAAKVIENAQRDINIAFINEVAMIFQKMDIDTGDVLAAARTKWNFLDFQPGLVGGHCIGVDPFYLAHAARQIGHDPEVILAGRRINDGMAAFAATRIAEQTPPGGRILVLGLTFKENVTDLRNSKTADLANDLVAAGHDVLVHDPKADPQEAAAIYGFDLVPDLAGVDAFDTVICAVAHDEYRAWDAAAVGALVKPAGLIADIKGIWRNLDFPDPLRYWQL